MTQIISWNVDGLYNIDRKHIIRNWLLTLKKLQDILHLQEIKANGFNLAIALNLILPGYIQTIAFPIDSWEARLFSLILIWQLNPLACLAIARLLGCASITLYQLWSCQHLCAQQAQGEGRSLGQHYGMSPMGNWVFLSHFNMVLDLADSSGRFPLIKGHGSNDGPSSNLSLIQAMH